MTGDHTFFQNRDCRYFPCHSGVDEAEFNCLFCYCPLYALGEECGGNFTYSDKGNKNCKNCARVHEKGGYDLVKRLYPVISAVAGRKGAKRREGWAVFAFSVVGHELAKKLAGSFDEPCERFIPARLGGRCDGAVLTDDFKIQVSKAFYEKKALIFIGAAGIAVRLTAPCIRSKTEDPAVICVDEKGRNVIPLLSGHIGGANELAKRLAVALNADAVITTATDINGLEAPDMYAKAGNLSIADMEAAKQGAAKMLEGLPVSYVTTPYTDISLKEGEMHLIPRCLILGVGCKRNTEISAFREFVEEELEKLHLSGKAVRAVSTIDLKKDEGAVLGLADYFDTETAFFSAAELEKAKGDFAPSGFVREVTGVDNVCERAVAAYSEKYGLSAEMLLKKTCKDGMTLAIGQVDDSGTPPAFLPQRVRCVAPSTARACDPAGGFITAGVSTGVMKVVLFAGTTEGRIVAKALIDEGAQLTVCTATDYGAQLIPEGCRVISGRLDADEMYELMAGEGFDKVVDATHPYALEVTENIRNACERLGLLYERIERSESETIEDERVIYFDGLDEAVAFLK